MGNCVVIGDKRKYLSCLLTLRVEVDPDTQAPTDKLDPSAKEWVRAVTGRDADTVADCLDGPDADRIKEEIHKGIMAANVAAVSNAQKVKKANFQS